MNMLSKADRQLAIDFDRDYTIPTCIHCGEPQVVELAEIWSDHSFMISTCCHLLYEELAYEMADPDFRTALLQNLQAAEHLGAERLRRVADQDGQLLLDCELEVAPIAFSRMKAFVQRHHDHCPPPVCWRYGAGVWNGHTLVGVVSVGRPVARMLPQTTWVEVNRLCVDRSLPDTLRYKACSTLYAWAASEAARRGFDRIITYTLSTESGMSLRYARWKPEHVTRPKSWNSRSRQRVDKTPLVPKVRWARDLEPVHPGTRT